MDTQHLIAKIEELSGQSLSDEQMFEIRLWQRGRTLASVPQHAREEIQSMIEGYVRDDGDACIAQDGADREAVIAKHAMAHASAALLERFNRDYALALEYGSKTPEAVKVGFRNAQMPPESV